MPFLYHILPGTTLSITQLHHALQLVVNKHQSLRTALYFDTKENILMQKIIESKDNISLFTFIESSFQTKEELEKIMYDERGNIQHFHLSQGLVFRCHLLHYNKTMLKKDYLGENDAIIFNFHHALFDFASMDIFHHDLNEAYVTDQLAIDNMTLRYLDCE